MGSLPGLMAMRFEPQLFGNLRTFYVAACTLNFTEAAKVLNITQSAVSQQIRHLEGRLGYDLFVRNKGQLSLTQNGQALFDTSARAFQDIERTLNDLNAKNSMLLVSCLPSFTLEWLMPRLPGFHKENPGTMVQLRAEFPHALTHQAIREGSIDAAIRLDPRDRKEIGTESILDEYLFPVATPKYLAQHPAFASGQSLRGIVLLHDAMPWEGAPELVEWNTWLKFNKPEWLSDLDGIQFNLGTMAINAAQNHQGVAMARSALIAEKIRNGQLVNVFNRYALSPAHYVLLTENHDNPGFRKFNKWLRKECQRFDESRESWLGTNADISPTMTI